MSKQNSRSILEIVDRRNFVEFQPRPDDPERYDQQTSFFESQSKGVIFLVGGNGAGTTECALAKVAKFILYDQPPPRYDTPFWIISNSYETVCESAWKEKLWGHGFIPPFEVDWPRVTFLNSNSDWPSRVPLKPWKKTPGRNWVLEFKSYEQGRRMMQARSLGGFCFIEQFPWVLLTEVLRGCREYSFSGNKICEFTPIEPGLTDELEEMMVEETLPPGWEVYRANTDCALEAGHVTKEWYDTFFGMVPDEMLETRKRGEWPTYEGVIYPGFNPYVHCCNIVDRPFPPNVRHRRFIDWGSGPENPFVCLWAFITGSGVTCVYDEYYSNDISKTIIDHLCEVHDRWPWPAGNPSYGTTWADPSDPGYFRIAGKLSEYAPKSPETGKPLYSDISISAARNAVLEGIEHVAFLLKRHPGIVSPWFDGDDELDERGCPRILIDHGCKHTKREMRSYRWRKSNPMGLNPKAAKREPLKRNDHTCDALRYGVFSEASFTVADARMIPKDLKTTERGIQVDIRRRRRNFHRGGNSER